MLLPVPFQVGCLAVGLIAFAMLLVAAAWQDRRTARIADVLSMATGCGLLVFGIGALTLAASGF